MSNEFTAQAIDIGNNEVHCYVTVIDAGTLRKCCTVSRACDDKETGYQRHIDKNRSKQITRYLDEGKIIPGAIILSYRDDRNIFDEENRSITFDTEQQEFFVIDGQHRLFGASETENPAKRMLPVCIFTGLELKQEVQYFLDINSTQKGVPATLRIELTKFLVDSDDIDQTRLKLFKDLNSEPDSPLKGRLIDTHSAPGKISHVPFKNALDGVLASELMETLDYDQKKKVIKNFINATSDVLFEINGDNKKLFTSAFFQAIWKSFDEIAQKTSLYKKNYKQESFSEILQALKYAELDRYEGSNEKTINDLSKAINIRVKELSIGLDKDDLF